MGWPGDAVCYIVTYPPSPPLLNRTRPNINLKPHLEMATPPDMTVTLQASAFTLARLRNLGGKREASRPREAIFALAASVILHMSLLALALPRAQPGMPEESVVALDFIVVAPQDDPPAPALEAQALEASAPAAAPEMPSPPQQLASAPPDLEEAGTTLPPMTPPSAPTVEPALAIVPPLDPEPPVQQFPQSPPAPAMELAKPSTHDSGVERAPAQKPSQDRDRSLRAQMQASREKDEASPPTRRKIAPPSASRRESDGSARRAYGDPAATAAYQTAVAGHLARFKRYPERARAQGSEGAPAVSFALDGSGRIVAAALARSSGNAALDAEVVAMARRASPFPVPPAGAPRQFSVSIRFKVE